MINSILGDPRTAKEFRIRGITRDPSKPNAKALINRGVECVEVSIKLCFLFKKMISLSLWFNFVRGQPSSPTICRQKLARSLKEWDTDGV